ncbi:nucleotide-binding universal stress UspA family protein [Agromyces hippuratus]|uniref:Nucleotide-binding universal stress UspA family protein n=1 Tax=Agromyces hippuratus TaxID=286438 RepID=A0A852X1E4_9MICO|nr:universal stress protein [Agromyces hippuratus]NYG19961.1 nucleotide-binding universal stress UspA family protein [Agromyces hippuratus]
MAEVEGVRSTQPVIVGVVPGQPAQVVQQAAVFASRFGTELVCAYVNPARYPVEEAADGSVESASLDPDFAGDDETVFDESLTRSLRERLATTAVPWRTLALAGDVAGALGHLAETLDAAMIVVGAHEHSLGGSVREFFSRSVGAQLAHRQPRPIVIVPASQHAAAEPGRGTDS